MFKKRNLCAILFIFPLFLMNCSKSPVSIPDFTAKAVTYVCDTDSIIIEWDCPRGSDEVKRHFELFYRKFGETNWEKLKHDITGNSATIFYDSIGNGTFELAVKTVTDDYRESEYHKSTDADAIPANGWLIEWQR